MAFENTAWGKYLSLKEQNLGEGMRQLYMEVLHVISYNIILFYGVLFHTSLLDLTLLFEPNVKWDVFYEKYDEKYMWK
jgi:hypothetical protein